MLGMTQQALIVGIGGFFGAITRWLVAMAAVRLIPAYPELGTLFANVAGAGCVGWLVGHGVSHGWMSIEWRLFLVTGCLGALTTFSTLVLETSHLSRHQTPWHGLAHLFLNLILGLTLFLLCEQLGQA